MKRVTIWHHSAGVDNVTRDWPGICRHHTQTNGWEPPCGYHLGVERVIREIDGTKLAVVECQFGRAPSRHGAHAGVDEYNRDGLGICVIGNYEVEVPSYDLLDFIESLQARIEAALWSAPYRMGHRDVKATLCPGENLYRALSERGFWKRITLRN